jgi:hypothetical protein
MEKAVENDRETGTGTLFGERSEFSVDHSSDFSYVETNLSYIRAPFFQNIFDKYFK